MVTSKGLIEEYRELQAEECELFIQLAKIRARMANLEKNLFIVASLNGVVPMSIGTDKKVVSAPEELVDIIAEWMSGKVPKGVLELTDSRPLLKKWADEEKFRQTLEFKFEGNTEDFLETVLLNLEEALNAHEIRWEASGRTVFYNKRRQLDTLVPLLVGAIRKS